MHLAVVFQNRIVDQNRREYLDRVDSRLIDFLLSPSCESVTLPNTQADVDAVLGHIGADGCAFWWKPYR